MCWAKRAERKKKLPRGRSFIARRKKNLARKIFLLAVGKIFLANGKRITASSNHRVSVKTTAAMRSHFA